MANHDITRKPFWPDVAWWLTLSFVLFCAGALRYTGYDFSLPYIEDPEEAHLNLLARDIILTGEIPPEDTHAPYPLGLIGIHYALLSWFHSPTELPSTVLPIVRVISITVSLLSVALLALLGYRLAAPQAGLAAAALWAISPANVHLSRTGAADNFTTFLLLLVLFLMLSGTLYHRNKWVLWGGAGLILAVLFTYQAVLLTPVLLVVPLWRLRGATSDERRLILQNVGDFLFLFVLFLIWFLWLSPLVVSIKMGHWGEAFSTLTLPVLSQNFRVPLIESVKGVAWIAGLIGLGWLLWPSYRNKVWLFGLAVVVSIAGVWGVVVSAEYTPDFQHLILISALLVVICGTGLAGWIEAFQWMIDRIAKINSAWVGNIAVIVLIAVGSTSQIRASIVDARQHVLPDRRNDLAIWADTTLEGGNHIADPTNDRVLNALFGGYRGLSMFPMVETALVTDRPLEEWHSREVMYAITPYHAYQEMQTNGEGRAHLDQMVLLKSYPPSGRYRDPGMVVFRLYPIQHSVDANLGSIHLIGYDIDRVEVPPGENLAIRYYWQAEQPTGSINRVFNHLDPLDTVNPVAQSDGPPIADLRRPTTLWNDPDETIVSQSFVLTVNPDVVPGRYRLVTGFYDPDTGQRLLASDGGSFMLVTMIWVTSR